MNEMMIVNLLEKCISSKNNKIDKENLANLISVLESIRTNILQIRYLDFESLKMYSRLNNEEIQELKFYSIMSELQGSFYELTNDQARRISVLVNKGLSDVKERFYLIDKNLQKDDYLRRMIIKIKYNFKGLNSEDLRNINQILKDNNIDVLEINKGLINLSLMTIKEAEKRKKEVVDKEIINTGKMSKEEFSDKLGKLLLNYGDGTTCDYFIKLYADEMMKLTTIKRIEDILVMLKSLNIKLNLKDRSNYLRIKQLLCYSSGEMISNVVKIVSDTLKLRNQKSFDYVFDNIAIFIQNEVITGYQNFIDNMKLFKSLRLSKELFMMIPVGVLCENSKIIKKNVLLMELYKIPREKYLSSVTILKATKNLSEDLDTWLELETNESKTYLEENISVLVNNQIKDFSTKLRIFKDLGINITVKDTYKTLNRELFKELDKIGNGNIGYLNGVRYDISFIPFRNLNKEYDRLMNKKEIHLLEDKVSSSYLYQKFINSLECVKGVYYNIPGVNIRISKNKVYRVFNTLINNGVSESRDMLIYAITYKSAISEEEFNNVCRFVDKMLDNNLDHRRSVR